MKNKMGVSTFLPGLCSLPVSILMCTMCITAGVLGPMFPLLFLFKNVPFGRASTVLLGYTSSINFKCLTFPNRWTLFLQINSNGLIE